MSDSWLEQFESRLDLLEQMACDKEAMFSGIWDLAQSAFASLATDSSLCPYLVRPDGIQQLNRDGTTRPTELDESSIRESMDALQSESTRPSVFFGSHPLANDVDLVCRFTTAEFIAPATSCQDGALAVTAMMASYVSRHLLSLYESQLFQQSILIDMVSELSKSQTLDEAASIVVNDGASFLGGCRLTLFAKQPEQLQAVAVTGVSEPQKLSELLSCIQRFVRNNTETQTLSEWSSVSELSASDASTAELFSQSNVQKFRVLRVERNPNASGPPDSCLLIECFYDEVPSESSVQQLAQASSSAIEKHLRAQQPVFARFIQSRTTRRLLVIGAAMLLLVLWPTDFEIEVDGQIQATNWRRIYAPNNGTVETVRFNNESEVSSGSMLLTMSNPDIELRLQRILGDIQTTVAKLASARTNRLTGSDPQASINEQILQTQHRNLELDRELLQKQADELVIKAPFDGTVFLRDPQKELALRPVQRGQLLLQLVAQDTAWQLELNIPDQMRQHLVNHQQDSETVSVRYVIKASPDQNWSTTLTSVDNAVQASGTELICKATAVISDLPAVHQRPGTTVTARIYCGRRSLGFVWFREVFELWRQLNFAWF